jgi:Flp pilus assembly protein TadD
LKPKSPTPFTAPKTRALLLAGGIVVLLAVLAYANSFSGAFVYDDRTAITENATIRQLWSLGAVLSPPPEAGTGGRPVANFTFALSYALSGLVPWGYHIINFALHALTGLVLLAVVRRTLQQPLLRPRFGRDALLLATAIATLWTIHPLQTQVVTYLSQRTESLMALFYLLTLYCFIRGTEKAPNLWYSLAVAACLLGVLSKEIIATAPLLVLLYDRTFIAGGFGEALRRRRWLYAALAATWIPLGLLLIGVSHRGVGYGLGIPWFEYALTECKAVLLYLKLSVWPQPLIFDRGVGLLTEHLAAIPFVLGLVCVLGTTAWALWKRPALGFAGAFFFVILAPASSVIPVIQQPIAENRPYLPSAAVVALIVLTVYTVSGRRTTLVLGAVTAAVGAWATAQRNQVFTSEISLWSDTVEKCPGNARAHYNLGVALNYNGRIAEAIEHYRAAVEVAPGYADAHNNLGNALAENGHLAEGLPHLEEAVRLRPTYVDAHYNLGNALLHSGRSSEAAPHYEEAIRLDPTQFKAHSNLGIVHLQANRLEDAVREFEAAAALNPAFADPHSNLAVVLSRLGRLDEAIGHAETALRLKPDFELARKNLESLRATKRQQSQPPRP